MFSLDILKDNTILHSQQFPRMQSPKLGMWKGHHLSVEGKLAIFCQKWYKKANELDLRVEPLRLKLCWLPPLPRWFF